MKTHKMVFPKLTTKTFWLGSYFNHYNGIVFFHTKPIKSKEGIYDLLDNKNRISGTMYLEDLKELYPDLDYSKIIAPNGNAYELEPDRLLKVTLEAPMFENRLYLPSTDIDGY